jgi:hypothetical protein
MEIRGTRLAMSRTVRFAQVDHIETYEAGRCATGVKAATRSDGSYPVRPAGGACGATYSWMLALEACFQLGGLVLAPIVPRDARMVLTRVDRATFHASIPFGTRLHLGVDILRVGAALARARCRVESGGCELGGARFAIGFVRSQAGVDRVSELVRHAQRLAAGCAL